MQKYIHDILVKAATKLYNYDTDAEAIKIAETIYDILQEIEPDIEDPFQPEWDKSELKQLIQSKRTDLKSNFNDLLFIQIESNFKLAVEASQKAREFDFYKRAHIAKAFKAKDELLKKLSGQIEIPV